MAHRAVCDRAIELKLELIQSHMAQNLDRAILSSSRGRLWFCNGPFALAESVAGRRSRLLRVCYTTSAGFQKLYKPGTIYLHRGALRGTPGSACPQPEPNATELPSCAAISARAAQRRRRRRWWRRKEGTRRPGPEGQVLHHILRHVLQNLLRRVLYVPALHESTATAAGPAASTAGFKR